MSPSTPIRLVALDLDGTLLDSQSQISPRTRQAIADAVGRGVIVLPCTGRPLASLPPLVAQLPGIRYAITANGAAVWDMPRRCRRSSGSFPICSRQGWHCLPVPARRAKAG